MNNGPQKKKETFETALERLEAIVRDLESGAKGLEDSLKLFEDGIALSRALTQKLEEAKKRVEVVTREGKDKLKSRPLEEVGGPGEA
ncbi:MAG: exodeoxyribonuclease VII small subunit [Elusimicrobia bacterium]|nr:exodeoxyribonuclease VII small subunit [Elusimicrobiota bacterium]